MRIARAYAAPTSSQPHIARAVSVTFAEDDLDLINWYVELVAVCKQNGTHCDYVAGERVCLYGLIDKRTGKIFHGKNIFG